MILRLIFVLFICLYNHSQAQSSFFLTYSAPATAIINGPVWTLGSEGHPVIAANVFRAGKPNPYELALISLDKLGSIKWQISYQSQNRDMVVSDIKTGPDGGIYVAGMWGLQMSSLPKPFLVVFDAQGRLRWSKFIPTELVNSRVKLACRANEIGLGFTAIENLYDFVFYRFDYSGNQRGALRIGGINSEDILVDLQLMPNGNFVAMVETNANSPFQRNTGIILFNNMSGIAASFVIQGTGNSSPNQLIALPNGELGIGIRDAQGYQWLQVNANGQNLRTLFSIDSLADYQQYLGNYINDYFIAQGPINNAAGTLELIQRGASDLSWALSSHTNLYSSLSQPIIDASGNVLVLATASQAGPDFNEQLVYIKTNPALDLCYDQKNSITKTGQGRIFNRANFTIQAGNLVQPGVVMPWTPQNIQFSPEPASCNTIQNTPRFPTAFSPNGDGLNDTFGPMFSEFPNYTLRIYDRWGSLLFEGENQHWDGNKQAVAVDAGHYPYVFDYTDTRGRVSRITGGLTLIR